jgi:ankyrin repeat protein
MLNMIDVELLGAASANNVEEVSRLVSVGADVDAKGSSGWTPLHWASLKGHVQVVNELVEHGADTEVRSDDGWTALHFTCVQGNPAVVKELRDHGANVEATNMDGDTPLHTACYHGHLPVVKALVVIGGANIFVVNFQGALPIHYAVIFRKSEVAKYIFQQLYATTRRLPLHDLLKDLTWIFNPSNFDALPLREALDENVLGTDDVVEILDYLVSQNPALLSSCDQDGLLPLHVACRRGASFPIVQFLVNRYKASVKTVTCEGNLPLFLACELPETSLDTIFILMKLYPDLVYR